MVSGTIASRYHRTNCRRFTASSLDSSGVDLAPVLTKASLVPGDPNAFDAEPNPTLDFKNQKLYTHRRARSRWPCLHPPEAARSGPKNRLSEGGRSRPCFAGRSQARSSGSGLSASGNPVRRWSSGRLEPESRARTRYGREFTFSLELVSSNARSAPNGWRHEPRSWPRIRPRLRRAPIRGERPISRDLQASDGAKAARCGVD